MSIDPGPRRAPERPTWEPAEDDPVAAPLPGRRRPPPLVAAAVVVAAVAVVGVVGATGTTRPAAQRAPATWAAVAGAVAPSVVAVTATGGPGPETGSGLVVSATGLVLTPDHLVEGATRVRVTLAGGTAAPATVVGADPALDLALVRVDGVAGLAPATFTASAAPSAGVAVVAVGRTGDRLTTTPTRLAGAGAAVTAGRTGAGDALVDRLGRVVGVATARGGDGTTVVPADQVVAELPRLRSAGTPATTTPGGSGYPF